MNRKQATAKADKLFSLAIRGIGYCQLAEWFPDIECNGGLQCCHLISRRYKAVRWTPVNARAGCAAHHLYGTHHPLEWEEAARANGVDWDGLKRHALNDPPMDPFAVIEELEAV